MLIERAHGGGRSSAPVYEGAEHFMGIREAADGSVIDPAVVRYTAERLHAESEVLKQQRLSQAERRAIGLPVQTTAASATDDPDDAPAAPAGGGKNPRGRGRGRK